jgi:hypothetical protein
VLGGRIGDKAIGASVTVMLVVVEVVDRGTEGVEGRCWSVSVI